MVHIRGGIFTFTHARAIMIYNPYKERNVLMGVIREVKSLSMKRQVVDRAVSLTVGAALGKIVTIMVADVIKPLISLVAGRAGVGDFVLVLREAADGQPAVVLPYGRLLQAVFDFVIIAVSVLLVAETIHYLREKEERRLRSHQAGNAVSPR